MPNSRRDLCEPTAARTRGGNYPPLVRLKEDLTRFGQLLRGTLTVAVSVEEFPEESLHSIVIV
jgi:hypothetical protein